MTRKNILLAVVILALGALYLYIYKDRLMPAPIQISHRCVEPRGAMLRRAKDSTAAAVVFLLSREVKLTSVKVIPVSELKTSKNPQALWELISDSSSMPVKNIIYGQNIRGMRSATKGKPAGLLQPGLTYRLLITAGSRSAEHDFTPAPRKS